MKIPAWKRWWSHFQEVVLEWAETDLNPDLRLSLNRGRLRLSTPNAIYSYADLYDNFSKSFRRIDLTTHHISEVLVLGFGLGSVPYMLEKVFHKKYHYTGVEADELVVVWASKYVLPELQSPVELQIGDAEIFVEMCERQFDLVVMDVFIDNVVPPQFEELAFLENLKNLLSENGLLMYNRLAYQDSDKQQTLDFFEQKFKRIFPAGKYLDVGHNWMLLNR